MEDFGQACLKSMKPARGASGSCRFTPYPLPGAAFMVIPTIARTHKHQYTNFKSNHSHTRSNSKSRSDANTSRNAECEHGSHGCMVTRSRKHGSSGKNHSNDNSLGTSSTSNCRQ